MGFHITGVTYFQLVEIGNFINSNSCRKSNLKKKEWEGIHASMDVKEDKPYLSRKKSFLLDVVTTGKKQDKILKEQILERYDCFPGIVFLSEFDEQFYIPFKELSEREIFDSTDSGRLPELVNVESYIYLKESLCKSIVSN